MTNASRIVIIVGMMLIAFFVGSITRQFAEGTYSCERSATPTDTGTSYTFACGPTGRAS